MLGGFLALIGLLSLFILLSPEHAPWIAWWVQALFLAAGWGAYLLVLLIMTFGIWLVLRNIDRLPRLNAERVAGSILLLLNLLTWMHLVGGGDWVLAAKGKGGGYLGALFERLFVPALGTAGSVVVLLAWLLIALAITFDISVPDLLRFLKRVVVKAAAWLRSSGNPAQPAARQPAASLSSHVPFTPLTRPGVSENGEPVPGEILPSDFNPIPVRTGRTLPPAQFKPAQPGSSDTNPKVTAPMQSLPTGSENSIPPPPPPWKLPELRQILAPGSTEAPKTSSDTDRARVIEETLASFGAPAHVVEIQRGPTVTLFGVEPDFVETRSGRMRVRVARIVSLADDLTLALAASHIRIQAPVPGRSFVGIEVPNPEISRVALLDVMESEQFQNKRAPLRFALGKDVSGKSIVYSLADMPHLLIAGTTGSGKSVCINAILSCLLLTYTPAELRLVLVDPKRVELTGYNGIPHLLAPVVMEAEKVAGALQWMLREMDARYHRFAQVGVKNIAEYNNQHPDRLPFLVVVIDELADLMMLAPDETERSITRLAQLARATGIHLVIATQRPSVDVVTGLIKANFPCRIAFAVTSQIDSRVILDQPGAERLLGRGDMLFQAPDAPAPVRLQGVHVTDHEIQGLVEYWKDQAYTVITTQPTARPESADMSLPVGVPLKQTPLWDGIPDSSSDEDPLLKDAIEIVRKEGKGSISMLQRRMRIGYTRAARLIDALEEKGIIGPVQATSQVREVLDFGDQPEDDSEEASEE